MELDAIKKIIADQLGTDESSITLNTSFIDDLGADSLDLVELIMALEEEFDMELADGEVENFKTVGDVVAYVKANS